MKTKELCGCQHDGVRWLVICSACAQDLLAYAYAHAQHIAQNPTTQYTEAYKARALGAAEGLV